MASVGTPSGKIVESKLTQWQISFVFYMFYHSGMGENRSLESLLQLDVDNSIFSGAVARTFQAGWEACDNAWMACK